MRLFQRYYRELCALDSRAEGAVAVDVSAVAEWYLKESEIESFDMRSQFPNAVSPFKAAVYEYRMPMVWKVKVDGKWKLVDQRYPGKARAGMLVLQTKLPDGYTGETPPEQKALTTLRSRFPGEIPRFLQTVHMFIGDENTFKHTVTCLNYADENGLLLGGTVDSHVSDTHQSDDVHCLIRSCSFPVYFGISLMHCKNVHLVDDTEHHVNEKKLKRRGLPIIKYKVISIDSMRKQAAGAAGATGNSVLMAMHIARGHWKDYTQGKGLFGRIKGRFWWEDYVRGDEKAGATVKTYEVKK